MLIVDVLGWWYTRGWAWSLQQLLVRRSGSIAKFFSIGDLLKTLFAPFRQDALNVKGAPIGVRLQALGGNIISRIFGAIIRSLLIVCGIIALAANAVAGLIMVALWPLLPVAPFVALVFAATGVGL